MQVISFLIVFYLFPKVKLLKTTESFVLLPMVCLSIREISLVTNVLKSIKTIAR